jgi:hypothetical protein
MCSSVATVSKLFCCVCGACMRLIDRYSTTWHIGFRRPFAHHTRNFDVPQKSIDVVTPSLPLPMCTATPMCTAAPTLRLLHWKRLRILTCRLLSVGLTSNNTEVPASEAKGGTVCSYSPHGPKHKAPTISRPAHVPKHVLTQYPPPPSQPRYPPTNLRLGRLSYTALSKPKELLHRKMEPQPDPLDTRTYTHMKGCTHVVLAAIGHASHLRGSRHARVASCCLPLHRPSMSRKTSQECSQSDAIGIARTRGSLYHTSRACCMSSQACRHQPLQEVIPNLLQASPTGPLANPLT